MHQNPYEKSPAADGEPRRPISVWNLITIAVCGIVLVGLALSVLGPTVQGGPAAPRTRCANNLKQIACAVTRFESSKKRLPYSFSPNPIRPEEQFNWVIEMLRECGEELLADEIIEEGLAFHAQTRLGSLVCPEDIQQQYASQLSYAVNMGLRDTFFDRTMPYMTKQLDGTPFASDSCMGAGGFLPMFKSSGERNKPVHTGDFFDGASNTILAAENYDATYWNPYCNQLNRGQMELYRADETPDPRFPRSNQLHEFDVGLVWFERNDRMYPQSKLNEACFGKWSDAANRHYPSRPEDFSSTRKSEGVYNSAYYYARPSGGHGEGFNISRFDGSTEFISTKKLDYEAFCRMMSGNSRDLFKDRDNKFGYNSIGFGRLLEFD